MKLLKRLYKITTESGIQGKDFFASFCASLCCAGFFSVSCYSRTITYLDLDFLKKPDLAPFFILITALSFSVILAAALLFKNRSIIKIFLTAFSLMFGIIIATIQSNYYNDTSNIPFLIGIAGIFLLIVCYVFDEYTAHIEKDIKSKTLFTIASIGAVIVASLIIIAETSRYLSYNFSCFDFGIFAQMFEKMRTTGLPLTTCERNIEMSHFGVHFSPFFYLLLPFYMIYPNPVTIIVLQAVGVVSGFLPIIFICRKVGLSNRVSLLCSIIYLLFPAFSGPAMTDFHENKFLSVLILWCVYFMLTDRKIPFIIFALLTLSVKEDAAIYIIALAGYICLVKKDWYLGLLTGIAAVAYFCIATYAVQFFGGEVMIGRLSNYIPNGDGGFISVIKTCFLDFGYVLSQVFTEDKILYIVTIMLPLAFLPFLNRNKFSLILLVPMLVINLMPEWQYQYDIKYQYGYGSAVLAFFLFICALKTLKSESRRKIMLFSSMITIVMFFSIFMPRYSYYVNYASYDTVINCADTYNEFIDSLPKDKEYTASSHFIPHMYDFDTVYMYPNYYDDPAYTEYLLVDPASVENNLENISDFMADRYELVRSEDRIALYKLKE